MAVADDEGVVGVRSRRRFESASVVKAMLLVGYLQRLAREGRSLSRDEKNMLSPMITESANDPATWVYERVGNEKLRRIAREAGMDEFVMPATATSWSAATFSARDQATFFWQLKRLTPPCFRDYAMRLLNSVVPAQSWGIPRVARSRGFSAFFKGGGTTSRGQLVSQATLVRGQTAFAIAVLTDGNPTMSYGSATIRGVARRVVARP